MDDIYMLSDESLGQKIGLKIREWRLRQDITQQRLAEDAQVGLSTLKKMEGGSIGSFDSFLRIMRVLGKLDVFNEFIKEEEMSPNEYYEFQQSLARRRRKRASAAKNNNNAKVEEPEW